MISRSYSDSDRLIPVTVPPLEPRQTHKSEDDDHVEVGGQFLIKTHDQANDDPIGTRTTSPKTHHHLGSTPTHVEVITSKHVSSDVMIQEDSGRERLKRHRIDIAGRVWIPDTWGQEELLKDWLDCSAFDASLVPSGIMSARAALVAEGRRANSGGLRIENRC